MTLRRGRKYHHELRYAPVPESVEKLEPRCLLTAAAYTWQNAAIGAGGFVDGIFYDSHNANVVYVRTDIGGLYKSTNDGARWQQLFDFVGNSTSTSGNSTQSQELGVLSFAIDPENSNNLYAMVGEYTGTNGAVFYSTDAGQTWNQTPLSFYVGGNSNGRATGERIAVDPYDSNILLLGSNANGLWQSNDAGHSFTQLSSFSTNASVNFVLFNPYADMAGEPTQNIFVGLDSTATGTSLYQTTDAGSTWTEITGTGSPPTAWMPNRAALASDGNLYLAYSNDLAPNGSLTNGGVFRFNTSTGTWANISPDRPQITNGPGDAFGYVGIALDPENSSTIVVTSFDRYAYGDAIWHTANANAAAPTWTALFDFQGYGGNNTTRNTTTAPWVAAFDDGIGNWAGDVAINPFNSSQLMYGTGQGIWATNHATSTTTLTASNSWYFPDMGIEFTAVGGVAAPITGFPLLSAMGDIGGFVNATLTTSPSQGSIGGSGNSIDFAGQNPNDVVIVGSMGSNDGSYSTNGGLSFTPFSANPGGTRTKYTNGTVALSANGSTIVWAPSGRGAYYSTNNGATWTRSTLGASGTLPTGGTIIADRVNTNYFYYWTENSNDNSWALYISTDAGHTFTASTGGALGTGNAALAVNPFVAGDLYLSSYIGIYHSTNFGASFTHAGNYSMGGNTRTMALGAPAPGSIIPAIYVYGTLNNFEGLYRSDDGGNTWVQLNDVTHQWGGLIQTIAADPNVFGRVYLGINGRGVIMGNPANSLPIGWSDADIDIPGNPGWATSSQTLSTGTIINTWTINGGGAGITGTSDQFNFASEPITGDSFIIANLTSLTDADGTSGAPQAGVMFRASADPASPFAAVLQSTSNQLIFESRTTAGGTITSANLGSIPIGSEYLQLIRTGNTFAAYYSSDAQTWTQLGSSIAIAMPAIANAGVAVTAGYNPQLASATFAAVVAGNAPAAQLSAGQLVYTFNANASAFISSTSLSLQPIVGGSAISPTSYSYNSANNTANFTLPPNIAAGIYQATLLNESFQFLITDNSSVFALPGSGQTYIIQQLILAPSSTLDIGDNTLIVQYAGASPAAQIAADIAAGDSNGLWNTPGIVSSTAAAAATTVGVGYFDTGSQINIASTWYGDANLDGKINADDLSLMLRAQSTNQTRWQDGNFNYDSQIDADDWSQFNFVLAYSQGQLLPGFSEAAMQNEFLSDMLISADPAK